MNCDISIGTFLIKKKQKYKKFCLYISFIILMFKGVETPVVRVDSNKYRAWRWPGTEAYIIAMQKSIIPP